MNFCGFEQLCFIDITEMVCYFFETCGFESLSFLNSRDKFSRIKQALVGTRIEPRIPSAHKLHPEFAELQISVVHIRNFQLTPRRGSDSLCNRDNIIIIEIESGDGIVGFGLFRLFFYGQYRSVAVELNHPIALRISHVISEYRCSRLCADLVHGFLEHISKAMAVENIVAKNQACLVLSNKFFADEKGLGKTVWVGLLLIRKPKP